MVSEHQNRHRLFLFGEILYQPLEHFIGLFYQIDVNLSRALIDPICLHLNIQIQVCQV